MASPPTESTGYLPRGAAWKLLHLQAPEVVVSGPAGTGKSVACLAKLHLCCDNIPNCRALIVRQTRASLTESALVSFENFVVPSDHPCLRGPSRGMRRAYHYPNGSTIALGGLDKPGKVMSSEFDLVYVQEAIELKEEAWEALTTRLRNGVLPYQQLLGDTNPDRPTHWLKKRCDSGRTLLLESRHEDNPRLWDADGKAWLDFARRADGTGYLDRLDALTGPRKARLRHGRWVQAEGLVYEDWDAAIHVIDAFPIPADWPRYWAIDFGFTNPLVVQWWAVDPDGRLYLYREYCRTQTLVEDAARAVRALSANEPPPRAVVCDHDAEGRSTFTRHAGVSTQAANKKIREGIQELAARLRPAADGKPRLFVLRDALLSRDPMLAEKGLPTGLAQEIDGYVWDTSANRKHGEEPVDRDNHSLDAARYMAMHLGHQKRICVFL